jgi:hypothetical protein
MNAEAIGEGAQKAGIAGADLYKGTFFANSVIFGELHELPFVKTVYA